MRVWNWIKNGFGALVLGTVFVESSFAVKTLDWIGRWSLVSSCWPRVMTLVHHIPHNEIMTTLAVGVGVALLVPQSWWERIPLPSGRVTLPTAARWMYEDLEARGLIEDEVLPRGPLTKLEHFMWILVTQAQEGRLTLYGKQSPSLRVLPLSIAVLKRVQPLADGTLKSPIAADSIVIDGVCMSARGARKAAKTRGDLIEDIKDLV
jgi:hypothetical protein